MSASCGWQTASTTACMSSMRRPILPWPSTTIEVRAQPRWITFGIDGRFAYPSTGDVIDGIEKSRGNTGGRAGVVRPQRTNAGNPISRSRSSKGGQIRRPLATLENNFRLFRFSLRSIDFPLHPTYHSHSLTQRSLIGFREGSMIAPEFSRWRCGAVWSLGGYRVCANQRCRRGNRRGRARSDGSRRDRHVDQSKPRHQPGHADGGHRRLHLSERAA